MLSHFLNMSFYISRDDKRSRVHGRSRGQIIVCRAMYAPGKRLPGHFIDLSEHVTPLTCTITASRPITPTLWPTCGAIPTGLGNMNSYGKCGPRIKTTGIRNGNEAWREYETVTGVSLALLLSLFDYNNVFNHMFKEDAIN